FMNTRDGELMPKMPRVMLMTEVAMEDAAAIATCPLLKMPFLSPDMRATPALNRPPFLPRMAFMIACALLRPALRDLPLEELVPLAALSPTPLPALRALPRLPQIAWTAPWTAVAAALAFLALVLLTPLAVSLPTP